MKKPRRQVKIYLQLLILPPPLPLLAIIHSIFASESGCCVSLGHTRFRPIPVYCRANVAAHSWFNAVKLSTTLAQHYSNTGYAVVYLETAPQQKRAIHPILFQHWNCIGWLSRTANAGDVLLLPSPEKPLPRKHDTLAQCWCNTGPPSVTLGQHYSNFITLSHNHEYNR